MGGCCGGGSAAAKQQRVSEMAVGDAVAAGSSADEEVRAEAAGGDLGYVDAAGSRVSKGLMHTNSMLFPAEAIEEAKKSIRLQKPINPHGDAVLVADDPLGVLMPADPVYELGMEIEYAADMKATMELTTLKQKKDTPEDEGPRFEKGHSLRFGYKTIRGRSAMPPSKPNQDSVVAFTVQGKPNMACFGIFDGHGPFGEHASHYCRMELHRTMLRVFAEKGDDIAPEDLLVECIDHMHSTFNSTDLGHSGVDPQVSGTTLIVALIVDGTVVVANVGDSRCIMGEKNSAGKSKSGKVYEMSEDHKPEQETERARVLASDAILMSEGQLRGGSRKEGKTYICRRRNGDIIYGVLFTRSVGDLDAHIHLGVSAEPEFRSRDIRPEAIQYLVLASDGVWDQMTNEQVLAKVFQIKDPLKASEEVAAISRDCWDTDRNHSRRDDITVLVVQLG